jgi:branched-chain amino acid transport system permease protein
VGLALGLCLVIDRWFWRSRFGQTLRQPLLAEPAGPAPAIARATLVAFMISTAMAGGAGSLFAHFEAFISPFDFTLEASLFFLALAAGGGFGSPGGAMLGALLFGGIIENVPGMTQYRLLISGLLLLLVGLWFPRGLYALLTTRRRRA